jgi:hypothetical protein
MLRLFFILDMAKSQKSPSQGTLQIVPATSAAPLITPKANFGGPSVWLSGITLLLTVVTVMLYAAGKAYRAAYLNEFGGSDWMVPWSSQELIYLGATCQLSKLLFVLPALLVFCLASMLCVLLLLVGKRFAKRFVKDRKGKPNRAPSNDTAPSNSFDDIVEFLSLLSHVSAISALIVVMCTVYVSLAEKKGTQDAREAIENILTNSSPNRTKHLLYYTEITRKIQSETITERGYAVTCNEKACLLYMAPIERGDSPTLKFVPLDNITNCVTSSKAF